MPAPPAGRPLATATLAALLLTLPALAGCLGGLGPASPGDLSGAEDGPMNLSLAEIEARLSQPVFDEVLREEHSLEGADGDPIWFDVYRPGDADGPVPVILVFTPYQSSVGTCDGEPHVDDECPYSGSLVDFFVPRGYAVAFADVRGNHNSGGCIDQTGPDQWEDGYRLVERLGTADWSNGRVGMHGASYDGETQISTARLNPPHLVTIVPTASVSNQYEYLYYDGVPYEWQGLGTMAGYLAGSVPPGTDPQAATTYPSRLDCHPENFQHGLDLSGDWNAYWQDRDYRPLAETINATILQVHGLQDWNVKPNHVDPIFNLYTAEKRLIVGQWDHAYPDSRCGNEAPDGGYGAAAPYGCRPDWELIRHRWYDHFLKGIDTGILEDLPPVLVQSTAGDWRGIEAFPPRAPVTLTLHLTADGALARAAPDEGALTLHDYPRDAPLLFADASQASAAVGTAGETVTGHPTALVFETDALEEALHTTGRPLLELAATTSAESTHWVVHLYDVAPDGTATWINRGYLDTRHRDGVDDPKPLAPGEAYNATVRLFPQDDVVPSGHRLRLVLTNDDGWVHQDPTNAVTDVAVGPNGTRLVLPMAPVGTPVHADGLRPALVDGSADG